MREIIRFGWGTSALGDFIIAVSGKGIVALEFSTAHLAMEDALRIRFPDAAFELSQSELADVIAIAADAIDDPATDCQLPIDLRGTPYEINVWNMLRDIPASQTTYYGELAARLTSRDPREVSLAIANNPIAVLVPCHRVIKKDGSISGYRWGVQRKRALLARERRADAA